VLALASKGRASMMAFAVAGLPPVMTASTGPVASVTILILIILMSFLDTTLKEFTLLFGCQDPARLGFYDQATEFML